jgi:hypothetical protein
MYIRNYEGKENKRGKSEIEKKETLDLTDLKQILNILYYRGDNVEKKLIKLESMKTHGAKLEKLRSMIKRHFMKKRL